MEPKAGRREVRERVAKLLMVVTSSDSFSSKRKDRKLTNEMFHDAPASSFLAPFSTRTPSPILQFPSPSAWRAEPTALQSRGIFSIYSKVWKDINIDIATEKPKKLAKTVKSITLVTVSDPLAMAPTVLSRPELREAS